MNNYLIWVHPRQHLRYTYTKNLFVVYMTLKFRWVSYMFLVTLILREGRKEFIKLLLGLTLPLKEANSQTIEMYTVQTKSH